MAEFVHGLDESDDVLDGSFGQYAVAEVEDVAGAFGRPVENDFGASADDVGRCEERDRVEGQEDREDQEGLTQPRPLGRVHANIADLQPRERTLYH